MTDVEVRGWPWAFFTEVDSPAEPWDLSLFSWPACSGDLLSLSPLHRSVLGLQWGATPAHCSLGIGDLNACPHISEASTSSAKSSQHKVDYFGTSYKWYKCLLVYLRLASDLLFSQGKPWTSNTHASTSQVLCSQVCSFIPRCCWRSDPGLVHTRHKLYQMKCIPSLLLPSLPLSHTHTHSLRQYTYTRLLPLHCLHYEWFYF